MKRLLVSMTVLLVASAAWAAGSGVQPFVRVDEEAMVAKSGPTVEVRIGATAIDGVQAVHVDLEYDPAGLQFVDFEAGDLFADPLVLGPFDRTERHVVDVTTATLTGPVSSASAEVGVLRFRVLDAEKSDIRIVGFQTAGDDWSVETQVSYANPLGASTVPTVTRLDGNVPNPFNPTTTISFSLSEPAPVALEIYNVSGRRVRTLVRSQQPAGTHEVTWDGRDDSGASVSSGVYFYRLTAGEYSEAKRMTLLR